MKKILFICTLFALSLVLLVFYYLPIKRTAIVELCCDDPSVGAITAEFDLRIWRSLFSPLTIDGTIRIGDSAYVPLSKVEGSFLQNIKRKVDREKNIPQFVNSEHFGQGTSLLLSDRLIIHNLQFGKNYAIEEVSLLLTSADPGLWTSCTGAS